MSDGSDRTTIPKRVGRGNEAALLLIGDELLSAKVEDANGPHAIMELRRAGVSLRELAVVGDDPERIAERVRAFSGRYDVVLTSGGVGPTHDDRTMEGIARAFSVPLVELDELRNHLLRFYGEDTEEGRTWLRMAQLPRGAELVYGEDHPWPVYQMGNVYVLPGIPKIFRRQLAVVLERFAGPRRLGRSLFVDVGEGAIAGPLTRAVERFDGVDFGSYPVLGDADYRVRVTVEADDRKMLDEAQAWLSEAFGPEHVLRVVDDD